MRKVSTKWPKIITCVCAVGIVMYIVTSLQHGVFSWNQFSIKLVTYGFWPVVLWGIWAFVCLVSEEKKQAVSETTKAAKGQVKWLAVALLFVVLTAIIVVHFSNTPATTRAGTRVKSFSERVSSVPQQVLSTPSSRLVSHTPSLEETVINASKNIDYEILQNQIRRRTLANLQGVHVVMGSDFGDQNLLDTSQVRTDVELKFRNADINVLSEEQLFRTKGRPIFYVDASVFQNTWGTFFTGVKSLGLYEKVSLERNPDVTLYLATWERVGKPSEEKELRTAERISRQKIKSLVEYFIEDYYYANPVSTRAEVQFTSAANGDKYSDIALKGLTEIHVPQIAGSDISVKTTIIPQLEKSGIKVLSSEPFHQVQDVYYSKIPYLFLCASFSSGSDAKCLYKVVLPLQLFDRVTLERNPEIIRVLPVWESKLGMKVNMILKDNALHEIRQDVQDMVDEFINAYLSVKSKEK